MSESRNGDGVWKWIATGVLSALFGLNLLVYNNLQTNINEKFIMMENNLTGTKADIKDLKEKIYLHLTNGEIHMPRSQYLSTSEFVIYKELMKNEKDELRTLFLAVSSENNKNIEQLRIDIRNGYLKNNLK